MVTIQIGSYMSVGFFSGVYYSGMISKDTFSFSIFRQGNLYFPSDSKKIVLVGKEFSVVSVSPEEITLAE